MKHIRLIHKGQSYTIEMIVGEHIDEAHQRLWKIIQHHPHNEYMYEQMVRVSKLWYYKNRFGCQYSEINENLIRLF